MKYPTCILFYLGLALILVVGVMAISQAHAAQQTISAVGVPVLQGDLRTSINAELIKANANFGEIYTALNGSPWLVQTTAPSIHNVFWIDSSGASQIIKYWDGDSWEVAASGGDGTYTLPTASATVLGGVKVGDRLTITDGVLSADVQSGTGAVDSVNTKTGTVVINPDDLVDTSTTNKFVSAAQKALLDGANQFKLAGPSVGVNGPTYLQGGAAAIGGVLFRFPVDLPSSGTELMTLAASTGQMGRLAQSTFLTPSGVGGALTFTASGFNGNLMTTDNTLQELADAVDNLDLSSSFDPASPGAIGSTTPAAITGTTITGSLFTSSSADGTHYLDVANGVAISSTPTLGRIAYYNGRMRLADGTDWDGYFLEDTDLAAGVGTMLAIAPGSAGGPTRTIASGAYTVDTASINANSCASAVAVTATGTATTDRIVANPNGIISSIAGFGVTTAGAVRVDVYPTANNVNFQFCNPTGAAIDPGSITINWSVLR